jgi:hypothetical protein
MKGRNRIRATLLMMLAAAGIVVFTACGANGNQPAPTTTSHSVEPTTKATIPGPNNFSPAPIAPLNPTASPGSQIVQRP